MHDSARRCLICYDSVSHQCSRIPDAVSFADLFLFQMEFTIAGAWEKTVSRRTLSPRKNDLFILGLIIKCGASYWPSCATPAAKSVRGGGGEGGGRGLAPGREVVYQAANQAANLQLCLLSARLTSQRKPHSHSAALSRIFEPPVFIFFFFFFQRALKSEG